MENEDSIFQFALFENEIDRVHINRNELKNSLFDFVMKLFLSLEKIIIEIGTDAQRISGIAKPDFFSDVSIYIDGCEQCLKWAFDLCEKTDPRSDSPLTKEEYFSFVNFMEQGALYLNLSDHFIRAHKNMEDFDLINQNTLRFSITKENALYYRYETKLKRLLHQRRSASFILSPDKSLVSQALQTLFEYREKLYDGYCISNEHFDVVIKLFITQAESWWISRNKVPEDWSFDCVSVREFKEFSIAVFALCLYEVAGSYPNNHDNDGSRLYIPIYFREKDRLVNDIRRISTCLSIEKIEYILRFLTYNEQIGSPLDCCPFVCLGNKYITTPHIFSTLPASEALMYHLANKDKRIDELSNQKENIQLEKIVDFLKSIPNLIFSFHIVLPNAKTDIDLLVYDKVSKRIVLAELKWFSGLLTISKVSNKIQSEIQKSIRQSNTVMEYINRGC